MSAPTEFEQTLASLLKFKTDRIDAILADVDALEANHAADDAAFREFVHGNRSRRSYAATLRNLMRSRTKIEWRIDDALFGGDVSRDHGRDAYGALTAVASSYGYNGGEFRAALVELRENAKAI